MHRWGTFDENHILSKISEESNFKQSVFEKINYLLFVNFAKNIKYLSKCKRELSFIADHYFDSRYLRQQSSAVNLTCFQFDIERGLVSFSNPNEHSDQYYIQLLWEWGLPEVVNWIHCFAEGILELQQLGIFHQDLCVRNTIQISDKMDKGHRYTYKIIDFDLAFKIAAKEGEKYQDNLQVESIVREWLDLVSQKASFIELGAVLFPKSLELQSERIIVSLF